MMELTFISFFPPMTNLWFIRQIWQATEITIDKEEGKFSQYFILITWQGQA